MFLESDKEIKLDHQPWIIENQVMLFEDWGKYQENPSACFTKAMFWIQLLYLHGYLEDQTAIEELMAETGKILEVDLCGKPARVKMEMDLAKPFSPGILLNIVGPSWVQFSYEYLPTLCYRCDFTGHVAKERPNFLSYEHALQDCKFLQIPYHKPNGKMRAQNPKHKQIRSVSFFSSNPNYEGTSSTPHSSSN